MRETVEQFVLLSLEPTDISDDLATVPIHRLGVTGRGSMLALGEWRLRHQGPEASLVGLIGEMGELLLGDGQLVAQIAQLRSDVDESPLESRPGHGGAV